MGGNDPKYLKCMTINPGNHVNLHSLLSNLQHGLHILGLNVTIASKGINLAPACWDNFSDSDDS